MYPETGTTVWNHVCVLLFCCCHERLLCCTDEHDRNRISQSWFRHFQLFILLLRFSGIERSGGGGSGVRWGRVRNRGAGEEGGDLVFPKKGSVRDGICMCTQWQPLLVSPVLLQLPLITSPIPHPPSLAPFHLSFPFFLSFSIFSLLHLTCLSLSSFHFFALRTW